VNENTLDAFFESKEFHRIRNSDRAKRLLRHLFKHSAPEAREQRTDAALKEFRGGKTTTIPVLMTRLQDALDRYFLESDQGREQTHRIRIVRGPNIAPRDPRRYALEFVPNATSAPLVRQFWSPHLRAKPETRVAPGTHVAYGLPMFFRDANHEVFTRYVKVNSERHLEELGKAADKDHPLEVPKEVQTQDICFPFVTLGDILSVYAMAEFLRDHQVPVSIHGYRSDHGFNDLMQHVRTQSDDVLLLGASRTSGLIAHYEHGLDMPYRIRINDVARVEGDREVVVEEHRHDRLESIVPVVITRMPGNIGGTVTMIVANHGRAVERVTTLLRSEDQLARLYSQALFRGWRDGQADGSVTLPSKFQIVLMVTVLRHEMAATSVNVYDIHWDGQSAREQYGSGGLATPQPLMTKPHPKKGGPR